MGKNKITDLHHACAACGSSDAATTYEDADGRAFTRCDSCGTSTQHDTSRAYYTMTTIELPVLNVDSGHPFLTGRGLDAASLRAYGAGFSDAAGGNLYMPSYVDGMPVFAKIRGRGKKFYSTGELPFGFGLYGWHGPSTKKHVLIVEGEADAWAGYQMMEGRMTVLSVPLGCKDAHERVRNDLHKLEEFERVYVMLDNDKAGQEATAKVLEVLNPAITYPVIGREGYKDASDYLKDGQSALFREVVYAAQHIVPKGFITPEERAMKALDFFTSKDKREGISFGFPSLDAMLGGQRPGEVITWVGGTGSGKSSFIRQLLANLYESGTKSLYVPLEDLPEVSDVLLAQLVLGVDYIHNPDADQQQLVDTVLKVAELIEVLQPGEATTLESLLHQFEYAVRQRDARVIVLDHITWLAESSGDATKTLQMAMPLIKSLAVKHGITVHLVSHMNRDKSDKDDTQPNLARVKHSAAIAQASDAMLGLSGDRDKNELLITVMKQSRLWGRTDTVEAGFTFTTAGRIIEVAWEDRLEDIDNHDETDAEDQAHNESASPSDGATQRVRGRRAGREQPVEQVDVRAEAHQVHDDSGGEQTTRPDSTQRGSSGAEGLATGGGEAPTIIVPPPLAPGYHLPDYEALDRARARTV